MKKMINVPLGKVTECYQAGKQPKILVDGKWKKFCCILAGYVA